MARHDVVVAGASAGGVEALTRLVANLPAGLPASLFVTLHLSSHAQSSLPEILSRAGPMPAIRPSVKGLPIEHGKIYVAPPDYHLLIEPGRVHLGHGPRENMQRPCINAMFRSAAASYGERVTGIVLTGMLDDGAAGLWEIQQHGGATMVQDPEEAHFPSMPRSAIAGMKVDHILSIEQIAIQITRLAQGVDESFARAVSAGSGPHPSGYSCPECTGAMAVTALGDRGLVEHACHTGHRFGLLSLMAEQTNAQEKGLYTALALLEEGIRLLDDAAAQADADTRESLAAEGAQRRAEARQIREILHRRLVPEV